MDSLDEFDIRDSFDAMDEEKLGRISTETFYILYLGMGYPKVSWESFVREVSTIQGNDKMITPETAIQFLRKHRRDRRGEASKCFSLVDQGGKGFISGDDIQLLARQVGEAINAEEAKAIMTHSSSRGKISEPVFQLLFAPPSP